MNEEAKTETNTFIVVGQGHDRGMDMRWRTKDFDIAMDKGFYFASSIYNVEQSCVGVAKMWIGGEVETQAMVGWIFAPRNEDGVAEWEPSGPMVFMMIDSEEE